MDLWVVAAAAGCGYLAKFCQKECTSESPSGSSLAENSETHDAKNRARVDGMLPKMSGRDDFVPIEVTSSSVMEHEIPKDMSISSSSVFPTELRKHDNFEYKEGCEVDSKIPEYPTREMGTLWRSKNLHLLYIVPRSSVDSCLVSQIEDYLRSPLASPCTPNLRPFLVSQANGRERYMDIQSKANGDVVGIPSLPKFWKANYSQGGKSSVARTSPQSDLHESASGKAFFSFGISIGMIYTIIANRLEWEKLKESMKTTENLVRDLQDELEKKDSLIDKELAIYEDSRESLCGKWKLNTRSKQELITTDSEESVSVVENETMSKIEAELEAELERLELSIKGSTLQERLLDSIEDSGELNADSIKRRSSTEPARARGSSSHLIPFSTTQGISPHELSLRLHEVIRSRLEDRITEIEGELSKSQRRIRWLESEKTISWRDISNSESSSSTLGSPVTIEAHSPKALDAYNEAYYDLDNLNGSQNGSSRIRFESQQRSQNGFQDSANGYGSMDDVDDLVLIKQIVEKARQGSPAFLKAQRALVYSDKELKD